MRVLSDMVMFFAGGVRRVDVDGRIGQVAQVMQELVPHVFGDVVTFFH